jgi:hypothetical protein
MPDYMNVVEGKYMMKGGVRDTLFGLIGATTGQSYVKSLGGLVEHSPSGKVPSDLKKEKVADATERHIGGKNATKIPGAHHGQVPYPGVYMKSVGKKL